MMHQGPAQIYKAHQRGHWENDTFRCDAVFNFRDYNTDTRKPFGILQIFNEETLAPGQSLHRDAAKGKTLIVIPVFGAVHCICDNGKDSLLVPGEAGLFPCEGPMGITMKNTYEDNYICYLFIILEEKKLPEKAALNYMDLEIRNTLHPFYNTSGNPGYMGIFDGREEIIHQTAETTQGIFAYAINGAFEVQSRLIEAGDALALWDIAEIEIEALSENAIILLLETPLET